MQLTFFIPDLLQRARATPLPDAPGLARLLQAAAHPDVERDGAIALLAQHFGVQKQQDWPLAALRILATGGDAEDRYWLRATPVTLEAGRDDVRVVGPVTDLDTGETATLLAVLQQHFAADGLTFTAAAPADWCVALRSPPALATRCLRVAIGDRLRPHLPVGTDASLWLRWGQEIEMLLHEQPVNAAREAQGRATVSGIWLQHGGRRPARVPVAELTVWGAADPDVAALAAHAETALRALPEALAHVLGAGVTGMHLLALPSELSLDAMEARFTGPAWHALRTGAVTSVEIIGDAGGTPAVRWHAVRPHWFSRVLAPAAAPLATHIDRALMMQVHGNRPA